MDTTLLLVASAFSWAAVRSACPPGKPQPGTGPVTPLLTSYDGNLWEVTEISAKAEFQLGRSLFPIDKSGRPQSALFSARRFPL